MLLKDMESCQQSAGTAAQVSNMPFKVTQVKPFPLSLTLPNHAKSAFSSTGSLPYSEW
jgi:propanediol dehydratase small subunit